MPRTYTDEEREQIIAMRIKHTAREVGEKFGITRNCVIGIWWRSINQPKLSDEERFKTYENRQAARRKPL
jgi:transposase-like protein